MTDDEVMIHSATPRITARMRTTESLLVHVFG